MLLLGDAEKAMPPETTRSFAQPLTTPPAGPSLQSFIRVAPIREPAQELETMAAPTSPGSDSIGSGGESGQTGAREFLLRQPRHNLDRETQASVGANRARMRAGSGL
jgi:hypothetical protein